MGLAEGVTATVVGPDVTAIAELIEMHECRTVRRSSALVGWVLPV
ncbi:hypothetical protein [Streptomyces sp. NTH33]|nr:hypothetical protein [Streptomyces sp. NTH33]